MESHTNSLSVKDNKYCILLCDDEADLLELYSESLELDGFYVETAYNGQEALEIFKKGDIDIIITDDNMPIMNGRRLLMAVKESGLPMPYFYFSTGNPQAEDELTSNGVTKILVKPYEIDDLSEEIRHLLKMAA